MTEHYKGNKNQIIDHIFKTTSSYTEVDGDFYRLNVGIVIVNRQGQLLWCRRSGQSTWQFAQGGIELNETPEQALYRELKEELGLDKNEVNLLYTSNHWYSYRFINKTIINNTTLVGQRQKWFLLELKEMRNSFDFSLANEFDLHNWVTYWYPLRHIINFKHQVYCKVMREFLPIYRNYFAKNNPQLVSKSFAN